MEAKTTPDYAQMSGPQLVEAYNAMAEKLGGGKYPPVKRFANQPTGVKRCAALWNVMNDETSGPVQKTVRKTEPETAPEETAGSASGEAENSGGAEKQESDVAKKAKKSVKKAAAKKSAAPKTAATGITAEFHQRAGSNRERLLLGLKDAGAKGLSKKGMDKATYGKVQETNSVLMVLAGLEAAIKTHKLPYQIVRNKDGEETAYVLKKK